MGHIDFIKYPFAARPQDLGLPGDAGVDAIILPVIDRLRELFPRVFAGIVDREMRIDLGVFRDEAESIACYQLLLVVARQIGDKRLINRLALAYAKTAGRHLVEEDDSVVISVALRIGLHPGYEDNPPAIPLFKEQVEPGRPRGKRTRGRGRFMPLNYSLPWIEYAEIVAERLSQDPAYSLENNIVSRGRVYLEKKTFVRVLEEAVSRYIANKALETATGPANLDISVFVEEAQEILSKVRWLRPETKGGGEQGGTGIDVGGVGVVSEALPPCIARIISMIEQGGNPSHEERFNLAAFLVNIGLDTESILEYFRKTPDFNEKIARYQVEHIAGEKGSRKKYMPYSCDKMKSTGICPVQERCKGGRNPLAVYKYNLRIRGRVSSHSTSQRDH